MQNVLFPERQWFSRPQGWLDWGFYLGLAIALLASLVYLFDYRQTLSLYFPLILQAAGMTLGIALVSMVLATGFGLLGALGRLSGWWAVRWGAIAYVEIIRGTPILVQLLLWGFGIGALLSNLGFDPHDLAFQIMTVLNSNRLVPSNFNFIFYGVLGLSFNYGAYLTEVFRTGIESVARGQTEAAFSLGMNRVQTMRRIVLPQAIQLTIPPFTNYFIMLVQDTALLSTIGVMELEQVVSAFAYPLTDAGTKLFLFVFGALFYVALCYPLSLVARRLEQ